jgi:hypothetical protein
LGHHGIVNFLGYLAANHHNALQISKNFPSALFTQEAKKCFKSRKRKTSWLLGQNRTGNHLLAHCCSQFLACLSFSFIKGGGRGQETEATVFWHSDVYSRLFVNVTHQVG